MIWLAWFVLFTWPIVGLVFYKRLPLPMALCLTILGGYILLPNGIGVNLPALPTFDKHNIFVLTAVILTAVFIRLKPQDGVLLRGWLPRDPVLLILLAMLLLSFFATAMTNGDSLTFGRRVLPGLNLYDAFSEAIRFCLIVAPFFLARKVLASPEGQRVLLVVLALSGLIYSLPALYEVRMSPHLHSVVYGYWHDAFMYYARAGGYRPAVFMGNGLELGIYTVFSLIAIACLMRTSKDEPRLLWMLALVWLIASMILYKVLGALLITLVLLPCVLFFKPSTQLLAGACIAVLILTYPMLRAAHLVPVEDALAVAAQIDPTRAASLNTRFQNEEQLLAKAQERPLFGWGSWGRNRIYTEWGRDLSLTDGQWVVQLGTGGWMRYISIFGLLCWPVIKMFLLYRRQVNYVTASLVLVLCAKLTDMIPNAGWVPVIWLITGSIVGQMEILAGRKTLSSNVPVRHGSRYARSFPEKKDARRAPQEKPVRGMSGGFAYKRPHSSAGYRK